MERLCGTVFYLCLLGAACIGMNYNMIYIWSYCSCFPLLSHISPRGYILTNWHWQLACSTGSWLAEKAGATLTFKVSTETVHKSESFPVSVSHGSRHWPPYRRLAVGTYSRLLTPMGEINMSADYDQFFSPKVFFHKPGVFWLAWQWHGTYWQVRIKLALFEPCLCLSSTLWRQTKPVCEKKVQKF